MVVHLIWFTLGLVGLVAGSEVAVRATGRLAMRLGVPTLVLGLTLTSIGTSAPEIVTNVTVGLNAWLGPTDASGIAVGNILGSCLGQITLLLGLAGLIRGLEGSDDLRRDGTMLLGAIAAFTLAAMDGTVARWEGALLVVSYLAYLGWLFVSRPDSASEPVEVEGSGTTDVGRALIALVIVLVSAQVMVGRAVLIAESLAIDETLVGIGIGFGTGLPELSVAISAVRQRQEGIALGNLLGSNITDPLLSFGLGAVAHPVSVSLAAVRIDLVFWVAGTVVAVLLMSTRRHLDRQESAVLLVVFALYVLTRLWVG